MPNTRSLILTCAACVGLLPAGACASASGGGVAQAGSGTAASAPHRNPNIITEEELTTSGETDALGAIRRLRPAFLSMRGATTVNGPDAGVTVYVDGTKFGDVSSLSSLTITEIKQIEYLNAGEATQRYGTGNTHGAILVTRK